jgi:hypothetical protein
MLAPLSYGVVSIYPVNYRQVAGIANPMRMGVYSGAQTPLQKPFVFDRVEFFPQALYFVRCFIY